MPKKVNIHDEEGNPLTDNKIDPRLGLKMREIRRMKNLTIREVAERVGCSATYITRIENGERRIDSTTFIVRIAQILGIPSEELLALSGQSLPDVDSFVQMAYPGVQTTKQKAVMDQLSILVTSMGLSDADLDQLLAQATSFAEYCRTRNLLKAEK